MFRRLAAVSLVAIGALALTACGDATTSEGDGSDSSTGDEYSLVKAGTLTVATEGTYRPFSFHEGGGTGALVGYDIEIIEAIADRLDLEIEFQETQWDAIFAGLDAGRFDLIANQVTINDEREANYILSEPYTVSHGVIVVPGDDDSINSFEDLEGKTTAQSLTSNWYELATASGAKVEPIEGWAQAVQLLQQGRVDATINDELTFLDYEKNEGPTGLRIAAETEDAGEQAFAFTKEKQALAEAIDGALAELRADGTLAEISDKYFGADVTE